MPPNTPCCRTQEEQGQLECRALRHLNGAAVPTLPIAVATLAVATLAIAALSQPKSGHPEYENP
jgi:hypothetical protein